MVRMLWGIILARNRVCWMTAHYLDVERGNDQRCLFRRCTCNFTTMHLDLWFVGDLTGY